MQEKIQAELKKSMLAKDAERTNTLRMLLSAFTNEMVSEARMATGKSTTTPLSDEEVVKIVKKEVKKRKDSIQQFVLANRPELAEEERIELNILQEFLPAQMSKEEILAKVAERLAESAIDNTKKGQFIGAMLKELGDSADGEIVKEAVDELVK